jgi:aminoglycoside 6-adenylyltransferase
VFAAGFWRGEMMRTEQEMTGLIINTAKADDRIRAVYMNGSRVNPNAPKDKYQDYDVVYVVTETASFIADKNWPAVFGNPLIIQEPDWNDVQTDESAHDFTRRYAWLMLFDDGIRIDLGIEIKEETILNYLEDKMTLALLDKDGILPPIPPPSDEDYCIKKPSPERYAACCNNFWWCLNNVAKGIARDELPYAMYMLNEVVRAELHAVIEWYIASRHGFAVSAGKCGKYFKRYLTPELYRRFAATYAYSGGAGAADIWAAVYAMCGLFHDLATEAAFKYGFTYRQYEEDAMRKYLKTVKDDMGEGHIS